MHISTSAFPSMARFSHPRLLPYALLVALAGLPRPPPAWAVPSGGATARGAARGAGDGAGPRGLEGEEYWFGNSIIGDYRAPVKFESTVKDEEFA